jgi:hypothetical protein
MRGNTSDMEYVLAELELGDQETLRAQADELVRAHHESRVPAGQYQAADPTRTIWVTVDRAARLVDVRINHVWTSTVAPDRFAGALFDAYTRAVQTALLVEASGQRSPRPAAPVFEPIPDELPLEEWEHRTRALLADTEDQLAAIHRDDVTPPAADVLRGRYGYLTLHLRDGGPVAITADPAVVRSADAQRLRQDALDVFAQAALGVVAEVDEDVDGDFGFEY